MRTYKGSEVTSIKESIADKYIPENIRGIVYLINYSKEENEKNVRLSIYKAIGFSNPFEAVQCYANTPNPASQVAVGNTIEKFEKELTALHERLGSQQWANELYELL